MQCRVAIVMFRTQKVIDFFKHKWENNANHYYDNHIERKFNKIILKYFLVIKLDTICVFLTE